MQQPNVYSERTLGQSVVREAAPVLVLGTGPQGLMAILCAKGLGAGYAAWTIATQSHVTNSSVLLIVLSPTVWVDLLRNPAPIFPLRNPAIVSMTIAFVAGIVGSLLTSEPDAESRFDDEKLRTYLGMGAE